MPVIKSAIKKLRQNVKKRGQNQKVKAAVKDIIDKYKKNPSEKIFRGVVSAVDKAAKRNIFHTRKAARLKSRLAKLLKNQIKNHSPRTSVKKRAVSH